MPATAQRAALFIDVLPAWRRLLVRGVPCTLLPRLLLLRLLVAALSLLVFLPPMRRARSRSSCRRVVAAQPELFQPVDVDGRLLLALLRLLLAVQREAVLCQPGSRVVVDLELLLQRPGPTAAIAAPCVVLVARQLLAGSRLSGARRGTVFVPRVLVPVAVRSSLCTVITAAVPTPLAGGAPVAAAAAHQPCERPAHHLGHPARRLAVQQFVLSAHEVVPPLLPALPPLPW